MNKAGSESPSFLHTLVASAYLGNSLGNAYRIGVRLFRYFPVAGQTPMMHDGSLLIAGDSPHPTSDDRQFFGGSWTYGVSSRWNMSDLHPSFVSVMVDSLNPGNGLRLRAITVPYDQPRRVLAFVLPSNIPGASEPSKLEPLPLAMTLVSGTVTDGQVWEASLSIGELDSPFIEEGIYRVAFLAAYNLGRFSHPIVRSVIGGKPQTAGWELRCHLTKA